MSARPATSGSQARKLGRAGSSVYAAVMIMPTDATFGSSDTMPFSAAQRYVCWPASCEGADLSGLAASILKRFAQSSLAAVLVLLTALAAGGGECFAACIIFAKALELCGASALASGACPGPSAFASVQGAFPGRCPVPSAFASVQGACPGRCPVPSALVDVEGPAAGSCWEVS